VAVFASVAVLGKSAICANTASLNLAAVLLALAIAVASNGRA